MTYKTAKKLFEGYVFSHTKQDNRCGYRTIEMVSAKDDDGKWIDVQLNLWDVGDESSSEIRIFQYENGKMLTEFISPLELVKFISIADDGDRINIGLYGKVVVNIKQKLELKEETKS